MAKTPDGLRPARPAALVTGGARGIGRAIAEALLPHFRVAITYRSHKAEAEEWAAAHDSTALYADLTDPEAPDRLAAAIGIRFGRLDALVNNAGVATVHAANAYDPDRVAEMMAVNLQAPLALVSAFLKLMPRGASILNISSLNARHPPAQVAAFAASKAGLEAATKALARELGPRGIRVNALAPGPIDIADSPRTPESRDRILAATPLGRHGTPEDVARAARFLVSPAAAFVTGEVLAVSGGYEP